MFKFEKMFKSPTFIKLRKIMYENFSIHYDQIEPVAEFELQLGMDSRDFFELLVLIEKSFEINFDYDEIDYLFRNCKLMAIYELIDYIEQKHLLSKSEES